MNHNADGNTLKLPGVDALLAGVTPNDISSQFSSSSSKRFSLTQHAGTSTQQHSHRRHHKPAPLSDKLSSAPSSAINLLGSPSFAHVYPSLLQTPNDSAPSTPGSTASSLLSEPSNGARRRSSSSATSLSAPSPASNSPGKDFDDDSDSDSDEDVDMEETDSTATPGSSSSPPNAPVFAVFRPGRNGDGLSMAASGSTLADMHREWRARWTGEDDALTQEDVKKKPFTCPFCRRRFDRPSIRQTHLNSHTGDRPYRCKVEGCPKTFSVLSNKYRHERSHEPRTPRQ